MTKNTNDTFNPCAHLVGDSKEIGEFLESVKGEDALTFILTNQAKFQSFLEQREDWNKPSFDPNTPKTCGEILTMLKYCKEHFDREYFELEDAMGGMSNGAKNASTIAKPWKKDFLKYFNKPYSEMSESDVAEIEMEVIDMFHFFAMMMVALGMDSDKVKYLYAKKNLENFNRQERGY